MSSLNIAAKSSALPVSVGGNRRARVDRCRTLVNRGEVWWVEHAEVGRRPFLVLTRQSPIPVLERVVGPVSAMIMRAVTSVRRLPAFPQVPTFDEAGVPGMALEHWWGVMAPARTPRPIVERLQREIVRALDSADLRERLAGLAVEPRTSTPEEFHALLRSELGRWARVVKDAGIKPE